MKIKYFCSIFFFILCLGILFSHAQNNINSSEKKYINHYFLAEKHKALEEYEKAKKEYDVCINENPRESAAFFQLAKIHFNLGYYDEAKEYALEASKLDPKNIWYLYLLIEIYYQNFEFEKQAQVWEDLIQINKSNQIYYLEAVNTYIHLELFKKALKIIQKAEKIIPENENLIILKSDVFQKLNDLDKAIEIILSAHKKSPKNLNFLQKLSELYVLQSKYELANEIYYKILKLEPGDPTALLASYKIFQTQNLKSKEKEVFLKIFKSNKINKEQKIDILFEVFSDELKTNRYKDYIPKVLTECILTYPEEVMFYVILGDFQLLHNDTEGALNNYINAINYGLKDKLLYEKILNIYLVNNELDQVLFYSNQSIEYYPFYPIFYYYEGLAFMYKKEYLEATKSMMRGLDYVIDDPVLKSEMCATLGDNYHKLGNDKDSDKFYDLALEINPEYIIVLNNYSYYLSLRGGEKNLLKAEEMIVKCLSLTEKEPRASFLDTYAWVLFQQGKYSSDLSVQLEKYNLSKKMMILCFENGGKSAVMHDHYGDVLFELNDFIGAKKQWGEALRKDPGNKKIQKKLKNF